MASRAVPSVPYERVPSPPFVNLTLSSDNNAPSGCHDASNYLEPSYHHIRSAGLTPPEADIITHKEPLVADDTSPWAYTKRRSAQRILDYLYLGPTAVLRDVDYLRREGITMAIVARDSLMKSHRFLSAERAQQELGITTEYINLASTYDLVRAFPAVVRLVNDHMLQVHNSQVQARAASGQATDPSTLRRGKILIMCESGNDRSAALVIGYLMTMFGCGMFTAIRLVGSLRFCCSLTEEVKRTLSTWSDILNAQTDVANDQQQRQNEEDRVVVESVEAMQVADMERHKRRIDDTEDDEDEAETDSDRFHGRVPFVPFTDPQ
ncbi:hypothetical protein S7711_03489 [Stachybotrys chartarum IBT 7711]|uniref:Tyrosine-protein phosphatase domain-containing protein n=1 Tax=Stachybotrys chartarum (strain CBS 109288 / IBT 7711) TaxID=1280523 RepID=A0A084AFX0_STACB|nr:hypothetical protein S7711_03489 [Stachybotrys chartarum IBT 7711]KFA77451.1 hypothetical protein S40288_03108 [Stachybotrys chartarum IBT 40288]